ncbi:hypothetical protein D5S17_34955 [Pseudonocardiaceae bacterium YIM PH 21723]|nr:hypothetical protein D5S17_34955 [Pseudonocardiaceae bacterium YIM PH 21723]
MPRREWSVSTKATTFDFAVKDADIDRGQELITVTGVLPLKGDQVGGPDDFPMVDWDQLKEFLIDTNSDNSALWFGNMTGVDTEEARALGYKPTDRLYLWFVGGEMAVRRAPKTKVMRYLSSNLE